MGDPRFFVKLEYFISGLGKQSLFLKFIQVLLWIHGHEVAVLAQHLHEVELFLRFASWWLETIVDHFHLLIKLFEILLGHHISLIDLGLMQHFELQVTSIIFDLSEHQWALQV